MLCVLSHVECPMSVSLTPNMVTRQEHYIVSHTYLYVKYAMFQDKFSLQISNSSHYLKVNYTNIRTGDTAIKDWVWSIF